MTTLGLRHDTVDIFSPKTLLDIVAKTNVLREGEPWWAERVALWQSLDRIDTSRTGRPSIMNRST